MAPTPSKTRLVDETKQQREALKQIRKLSREERAAEYARRHDWEARLERTAQLQAQAMHYMLAMMGVALLGLALPYLFPEVDAATPALLAIVALAGVWVGAQRRKEAGRLLQLLYRREPLDVPTELTA